MSSFQDEITHDILALLGEAPPSPTSQSHRPRSGRDDHGSSRRRSNRSRRSRNDSDDDDDSDFNMGGDADDDDRDPWGPDLIGDSKDRAYLDSLPELEREQILAERAEQRQRREERRAVAEKLREQQSQRPSRRSDSNTAAADKKRKLQALKEKRSARRSNRYSDSDSDYNEDRPSTRKRHRRDRGEEDDDVDVVSDVDGADARDSRRSTRHSDRHRDHARGHHRDRSHSPAYDPTYSPTRNAHDRSSSPRRHTYPPRDPPVALAELNAMMLTRTQIEKYCYADFFEDLARDTFVRLRVGENGGEPVYRVCQIADVTEYKRPYLIQTVRTNKAFMLKHASAEKVFLADVFSNTPFLQTEFDRWRLTCESESIPLPTKSDSQRKAKEIAQAEAHIFTDAEISAMVKKKMALPGAVPRNFAAEKSVLIKKLQLAKANGDRAGTEEIMGQLRQLDATVAAKVFGDRGDDSAPGKSKRPDSGNTMLASAMGGKNIFKNPALLDRKRPSDLGTSALGGSGSVLVDIPGISFAPAGPPLPDFAAGTNDDDGDDQGMQDLYKSAPKLDLDL